MCEQTLAWEDNRRGDASAKRKRNRGFIQVMNAFASGLGNKPTHTTQPRLYTSNSLVITWVVPLTRAD